ncbi:MAG: pduL [Firmicutes bacterium]|nr:pduL [Bacillota bacterium]
MNELLIKKITEQVIAELKETHVAAEGQAKATSNQQQPVFASSVPNIPVGVSARHLHVCQEHLEILFGKGHKLTKLKDLPQPGEYAAKESVTLIGQRLRAIEGVKILGDLRPVTQVEVSRTDARYLGIKPEIRRSGDTAGSPGITIVGPAGSLQLTEGVIVANRHIHMNPNDAQRLGVSNNDEVDVRILSTKPTILGKVQIRVSNNANLYMHIDVDDANAVAFDDNTFVEILNMEESKCCWQG